jgi:ribosomal protein S18 acetylase RimI-like enzyme
MPHRPSFSPSRVVQGFFPGGFSRIVQPRLAGTPGIAQPNAHGSAVQLPDRLADFRTGGSGRPLPEPVRQKMEGFFGADFSDVRVHVGPEAPAIGALAFTLGSNLYFAPGQYDPGTPHGQRLLGHELTHVVQQRAGRVRNPFGSGVAVVQDPLMEAEAERMGMRAAAQAKPQAGGPLDRRGESFHVSTSTLPGGAARQIRLAAGGREVGSVEVRVADRDAVQVMNLQVDPAHRKQGAGVQLMKAAAHEGMRMGRTRVTLESQDSGSGHLTRWYEGMGFQRRGRSERGMVVLETNAVSLQSRRPR